MLRLPREMLDAIVAHARQDHPIEACGVVAGRNGSPTRLIAMTNAEHSPKLHRFDGLEQLAAWRSMDDADEVPLVIYHSHTATHARPSERDIRLASIPEAHYLIVSTSAERDEVRAFLIRDGSVTEDDIAVM